MRTGQHAARMTEPTIASSPGTFIRLHRLLRSNWITSCGAALMTLAVMGGATLIALHSTGSVEWTGPYAGLVLTIFFVDRYRLLTVAVYLGMGWLGVIAVKPMLAAMPMQ